MRDFGGNGPHPNDQMRLRSLKEGAATMFENGNDDSMIRFLVF